jgi:hypothetical protein
VVGLALCVLTLTTVDAQDLARPAAPQAVDLTAITRLLDAAGVQPTGGSRLGAAATVGEIDLDVPNHGRLRVVVEKAEVTALGSRLMVGHVAGERLSLVVFTVNDGQLSGSVDYSGGSFQFDSQGFGWVVAPTPRVELRDDVVGDQAASSQSRARLLAEPLAAPLLVTPVTSAPARVEAAAGDPLQIELIVFFTPAARQNAGSLAAIVARIEAAGAALETALARSLAPVTAKIVSIQEVDYVESGNTFVDMDRMRSATHPLGTATRSARDQAGADLVHLVTGRGVPAGLGGRAFPTAMSSRDLLQSITVYQPFPGTTSFPTWIFLHELAHALGLSHHSTELLAQVAFVDGSGDTVSQFDPAYASGGSGFGYGPLGEPWGSIVYEVCVDCVKVPVFANPRLIERGVPMGDPELADSVRAISENAFFISEFSRGCTYQVTPSLPSDGALTAPGDGGTLSFSVVTDPACPTSVRALGTPWLSVSPPIDSRGSATVTLTLAKNTTRQARGTTIVIGDRKLGLTQPVSCNPNPVQLLTTTMEIPAAGPESWLVEGGGASIYVDLPLSGASGGTAVCPVTSTSDVPWLITARNAAWFEAQSNNAPFPRTGTLTVNGQTLRVTQAPGACAFGLSESGALLASTGQYSTDSVLVLGDSRCDWTASTTTPWISFPSGTSGVGGGPVKIAASPNTTGAVREGQVTVAGIVLPVFQLPDGVASCEFAFAFVTQATGNPVIPPTGGSIGYAITTAPGCPWTLSGSRGVTLSSRQGSGSAVVTVAVAANDTRRLRFPALKLIGGARTLTGGGAMNSMMQFPDPAIPCGTKVTANPSSFGPEGGTGVLTVESPFNCGWTLSVAAGAYDSGVAPWLKIASQKSSSISMQVAFTVEPTASIGRTAMLRDTMSGASAVITQAGLLPMPADCKPVTGRTLTVTDPAGGLVAVDPMVQDGCDVLEKSAVWVDSPLTYGPATRVGNRFPFELGVQIHGGAKPRTAMLNLNGIDAIAVTQLPRLSCKYLSEPAVLNLSPLGGSASVRIRTLYDCDWTAQAQVPWIRVAAGSAAGLGSKVIDLVVDPNPLTTVRTGTVLVGEAEITVSQGPAGDPTAPTTGTTLIDADGVFSVQTTSGGTTITTSLVRNAGTVTVSELPGLPAEGPSLPNGYFALSGRYFEVTSTVDIGVAPPVICFPYSQADLDSTAVSERTLRVFHKPSGATDWVDVTLNYDEAANRVCARPSSFSPFVVAAPASSATYSRFLAEGATSALFDTRLSLFNPSPHPTAIKLTFSRPGAAPIEIPTTLQAYSRRWYDVKYPPGLPKDLFYQLWEPLKNAEFSLRVENSGPAPPVVVDRTMSWDPSGYGAHAETAVPAPALTWYLAEGSTVGGFNLFYLLQNPHASTVPVRVRFLRPSGEPLEKIYELPPTSRTNIWVNFEEFGALGRALASSDVSAVIQVLDTKPIVVERAMYLDVPGQPFGAGHESAGVTAPAMEWFLAEGATGTFFDLFILLANPGDQVADVEATYLRPDGSVVKRRYQVPGNSRFNVWVDYEDPLLADTAVSTTITSLNAVPIIVERTMWWPGGFSQWHEAHNSPGATASGTKWALAEGEVGDQPGTVPYVAGVRRNKDTYILVANTSDFDAQVKVTLYFNFKPQAERTFVVKAKSRFNVDVRAEFAEARDEQFSVIVESVGEARAQLIVERAMYWNAGGQTWAAGTNALATRLQ